MHAIARSLACIVLFLACVRPTHAEDRVPREAWFDAMQAADPAAALALYDAAEAGGASSSSTSLAIADRARIRGRAVDYGREIVVDEKTVRLQVHGSDDAWLLLTWRRREGGWRVAKTEELAAELFEGRGPLQWPASATEGVAAEDLHAFLIRWAKTLQSRKWTAKSMAAEFFLPGASPSAVRELVLVAADRRVLPVVLADRVDATGAAVRMRWGEGTFRIDVTHPKEGWRISEIVEVPHPPTSSARWTRADGEQIARLATALERALQPDGSPKILLEAGIDGDGATPIPFTEASARAQLERWRAEYGPIAIQKVNPRDFEGAPASTGFSLTFSPVDDTKSWGYVRFLPRSGGCRLLGLRSGVREEIVPADEVVGPR